eukprot:CAMPEP_0179104628 /NCGR_PEP_ID=MMETSP0796-20121207/48544_1 /TAXON_ID=73915 /ORGANISM="Pyrodinium bahamense, Strain pbaha01" /LENGTH=66 /DNA_ID=CAMNT_0020802577 /DNA_START=81 /DNA_END=278 /DNA_ORIENTATION=-
MPPLISTFHPSMAWAKAPSCCERPITKAFHAPRKHCAISANIAALGIRVPHVGSLCRGVLEPPAPD